MRSLRPTLAGVLLAVLTASTAEAYVNPQVAGLQVALRARGLYRAEIDAVAGPQTVRAVRVFQRRQGLRVDGIAGPRTRRALGRLGRPLFGRRLVEPGRVGWDVSVLQFLLTRRGEPPGSIDGYFGPATLNAVTRFQRRMGLPSDGLVGRATVRSLLSPRQARQIRNALRSWARRYGLRPSLVRALAWVESGYQSDLTSLAGAQGIMQVTPATWRYVETILLGEDVPRTASGNIRIGVTYLHSLLHRFRFNRRLALGAYNQGPASVRRHGLFPETRAFVRNVLALSRRI
jgi:peptidoglycan hydrolase-like protein with peptidoglycan-binding domain